MRKSVAINLRLSEEEHNYCISKGKGNKSEFIRSLIQADMRGESSLVYKLNQVLSSHGLPMISDKNSSAPVVETVSSPLPSFPEVSSSLAKTEVEDKSLDQSKERDIKVKAAISSILFDE